MLRKSKNKGQTTAEYAIIIALVVGAVVAMQLYVKRGINSRIMDVVDHTGQGGDIGGSNFQFTGDQREPYYLTSSSNTNQQASSSENMAEGGATSRSNSATTSASQTQTMGWNGNE